MECKSALCVTLLTFFGCPIKSPQKSFASTLDTITDSKKIALVYVGPGAYDEIDGNAGSTELVDNLIRLKESGTSDLEVVYANPQSMAEHLSPSKKQNVALVAFPGGPSETAMQSALAETGAFQLIKNYVAEGGKYLGVCAGAYLAGSFVTGDLGYPSTQVGLDFVPHRLSEGSDQKTILAHEMGYLDSEAPAKLVSIQWLVNPFEGQKKIYFQNGPAFYGEDAKIKTFGRYNEASADRRETNGTGESIDKSILARKSETNPAAAVLFRYEKGKVALIGPHTEASKEWFNDEDTNVKIPIPKDYEDRFNLGSQMILELMAE
jgi:glutamine amidotransferase-like uncharacterized protein